MDSKEIIARRVARELKHGQLVNLGIGLPTLVASHLPEGVEVFLQAATAARLLVAKPVTLMSVEP